MLERQKVIGTIRNSWECVRGAGLWEKVRICLLMNDLRAEMMQSGPVNLSRHYRLEIGLCALHSNPDAKLKELYSMRRGKAEAVSEIS